MLATVEIANREKINGLIVALDAKKAFDSVSHSYIETCLKRFGCSKFVPIFKTLYKDLQTDIMFNSRLVTGFKILRGVKQGDALSCILFIMCMEPLLRNIERNPAIKPLVSTHVEGNLPKSYAYADDVSATIQDEDESLSAVFKEYERLTKLSGLELNADKTEIMKFGNERPVKTYDLTYLGKEHKVTSSEVIKLNGIFFHRDTNEVRRLNVKEAISKMDLHFRKWSRRSLSTLGKILITKTFGISQVVYLMQTLKLYEADFKLINATMYKFIWNRHYLASKAPERLKREIVNKPVKLGGLGMLDISELDASLKIKAVGRLFNTKHPFLKLIGRKVDVTNFFDPVCKVNIEGVLEKGLELLKLDRLKIWANKDLNCHRNLLNVIRNCKIKDILSKQGQSSVIYFVINRQARKIKDLNLGQLAQLERFIEKTKLEKLRLAISLNIRAEVDEGTNESYLFNDRSKHLAKCTSKEIRTERSNKVPITSYKLGLELGSQLALNWGYKITKLTSIRHKLNLLKVAHGEVYTKERLYRFGMTENDKCPRCSQTETLMHKIYDCEYSKRIWQHVSRITHEDLLIDPIATIMGVKLDQTLATLTLKAEIIGRILVLKEQNYLLHPKHFVKLALENLIKREQGKEIKDALNDLLSGL